MLVGQLRKLELPWVERSGRSPGSTVIWKGAPYEVVAVTRTKWPESAEGWRSLARSAATPVTLGVILVVAFSLRIDGISSGVNAGAAVDAAGDVNGDGIDDLILGADFADPNGVSSGEACVLFGRTEWPAVFELADLNGENGFQINGEFESDRLGDHEVIFATEEEALGTFEFRQTREMFHGFPMLWWPDPAKIDEKGARLVVEVK